MQIIIIIIIIIVIIIIIIIIIFTNKFYFVFLKDRILGFQYVVCIDLGVKTVRKILLIFYYLFSLSSPFFTRSLTLELHTICLSPAHIISQVLLIWI